MNAVKPQGGGDGVLVPFLLFVIAVAAAIAIGFGVQFAADAEKQAKADRDAERVVSLVDLRADQVSLREREGVLWSRGPQPTEEFCTEVTDPQPLNPETHVVIEGYPGCFEVWTVESLAESEVFEREQEATRTIQYVLGDLYSVHAVARFIDVAVDQYGVPMPEYEANGIMRDAGFQARAVDAGVTVTVIGDTLVFEFPADEDGAL